MRIQFEIVSLQVEKLFKETVSLTDVNEINKQFDFIREFIESTGWSYDDYVDHMMGWNKELNNN